MTPEEIDPSVAASLAWIAAPHPMKTPVCLACGHRHGPETGCPGHQWDDVCPYEGTACEKPAVRAPGLGENR